MGNDEREQTLNQLLTGAGWLCGLVVSLCTCVGVGYARVLWLSCLQITFAVNRPACLADDDACTAETLTCKPSWTASTCAASS